MTTAGGTLPTRRSRRSRRDGPPLAILVDYDGTISLTDVADKVMAEHVPGVLGESPPPTTPAGWARAG